MNDPENPASPSKKNTVLHRRFKAQDYMLCILYESRYRRIFSPDFDFHFTVPTGEDPYRWITLTLQQAEKEIEFRLNQLTEKSQDHPIPKKWKAQILFNTKKISIHTAALQLQVSESTLRRLADEGKIPFTKTHGGHRRFLISDLETDLSKKRSSHSLTKV